jgi:hypothetical protein
MQQIKRKLASLIFASFTIIPAFATPRTSYTTNVRLHDGKHVECAVNQSLPIILSSRPGLTTRERNEAEIDATARLRRVFRSKNQYPSPGTAPHVQCS